MNLESLGYWTTVLKNFPGTSLDLRGNSTLLRTISRWETSVRIPGHLCLHAPLACEGTPSINLGIMKVMSIFVILARYCHIGWQQGGVPTKVHADRAVEEVWEGQGPTKWRCDLARGVKRKVEMEKMPITWTHWKLDTFNALMRIHCARLSWRIWFGG
jgi:hypothetical protein